MGDKHIIIIHMIILWAWRMVAGIRKRIRVESCMVMPKNKDEKCVKSAEMVFAHQRQVLAYVMSTNAVEPFKRVIILSDNVTDSFICLYF